MRKLRKAITGILLAVTITATSVFPIPGTAAPPGSNAPETENTAANTKPAVSANLPAAVSSGSLPMADSYDINPPVIESFELEENGQTLNQNDTLHTKLATARSACAR